MPKRTVIKPVVQVEEKPKFVSSRKKGKPPLRLDVLQKPVEGFERSKIEEQMETPKKKENV